MVTIQVLSLLVFCGIAVQACVQLSSTRIAANDACPVIGERFVADDRTDILGETYTINDLCGTGSWAVRGADKVVWEGGRNCDGWQVLVNKCMPISHFATFTISPTDNP